MKNLLIFLCLGIAAISYVPKKSLLVERDVDERSYVEDSDGARYRPSDIPVGGGEDVSQSPALRSLTIESSAYCIHGKMASGQITFAGAAASNFLPFRSRWFITSGPLKTKEVQILDRHHKRYAKLLDVWVEDCNQALQYGRRQITVERQGEMK